MSFIVALAGNSSAGSPTLALVGRLAEWLRANGHEVRVVPVRALPGEALLSADTSDPQVADAVAAVHAADGVIVASPVYKASYSGVLKTFLDLLPRAALAGKAALPLLTGDALTHAPAVDSALRPVLIALGAWPVVPGLFVLDKQIRQTPEGVVFAPEALAVIRSSIEELAAELPVAVKVRR